MNFADTEDNLIKFSNNFRNIFRNVETKFKTYNLRTEIRLVFSFFFNFV